MLSKLLQKSDWAFLLDFVSPAFFKVIPPLELISNATAMAKRSQDVALYRAAQRALSQRTFDLFPDLRFVEGQMHRSGFEGESFAVDAASREVREVLAARIVELYFAQLYSRDAYFFDLRLSRFAHQEDVFCWSPAPLLGVFSVDFSRSMYSLYEGYYGDDHGKMKEALKELNLDWAYDVFIHHFGEGDQTSVQFTMSHFIHTFHEIFVRCKSEKKSLRGEFVQLGVVLGLMYESLETLNVPVDVRAAFRKASVPR